jgi:hypothetical protein
MDTPGEWWRNCGVGDDGEVLDIDRIEDELAPLDAAVARVRGLIGTLEMCHHKAERWVESITEAIGGAQTPKGLGTRARGQVHPVEQEWMNACTALSAWCAGSPPGAVNLTIGGRPASEMLARLGQRSDLKEWQVHRVIDRVRGFIGWPWSEQDASTSYEPVLECGGDYESVRRADCPERYREHADHWRRTVETFIHDTVDGQPAEISLGLAIDMLMPCHWDFVRNLEIVLGAIGGDLHPATPYAACGRNIKLSPIRDRMRTVCRTLRAFVDGVQPDDETDRELLALLGEPTVPKQWLAASLDKTIRLQLHL